MPVERDDLEGFAEMTQQELKDTSEIEMAELEVREDLTMRWPWRGVSGVLSFRSISIAETVLISNRLVRYYPPKRGLMRDYAENRRAERSIASEETAPSIL